MRKIILNNTIIPRLDNFNRNYDFNSDPYVENISLSLQTDNLDALVTLQKSKITDIVITEDDNEIYSLHNLNGKITHISESLSNTNQKIVGVSIKIIHDEVEE